MAIWILRATFMVVAIGLAVALITLPEPLGHPVAVFALVLVVCCAVIGVDMLFKRKRIEVISCVYFGTVVGLFLAYMVALALTPILRNAELQPTKFQAPVQLILGVCFTYACISLLMQTRNDFRFIIPYIEFAKEVKGLKPYVLDTSVVIDGRIADLVETNVLDNQLIMPRFVLSELQGIADSSDKMRRTRGRRGLDILNRLRSNEAVDLEIYDRELPEMAGQPVDMKLVLLAKHLEGKVVTGDYNLNKVARLHNVPVINLNEIANSLKPVFLPGESLDVRVVKLGEEAGQGVGYLDDGTMVVIESGRDYVNKMVHIAVTSVLQTSAGRMIFGRFEREVRGEPRSAAQTAENA